MKLRLDKMLSHMGYGSRGEIKKIIKKQRVQVDGVVAKTGSQIVDTEKNGVTLDNNPVSYVPYVYFMLNKPAGVVSATEDAQHRTVLDLLDGQDFHDHLFPVGRLDKDTTGLLFITNDGDFSHFIISPKKGILKKYLVELEHALTLEEKNKLESGIQLKDGDCCAPAQVFDTEGYRAYLECVPDEKKATYMVLGIEEGKYHQVKRMVTAVGNRVVSLKRVAIGAVNLDPHLKEAHYRPLTVSEIQSLYPSKP